MSRTSAGACFPSRRARAGLLPHAQPMRATSSADTLSYSPSAALLRAIFSCSSNRKWFLEGTSRNLNTRPPWNRWPSIVRWASVSNCRETSNCGPHSTRWIGSGVTVILWVPRTCTPTGRTVFMPRLACAGLSEDMATKVTRLLTNTWGRMQFVLALRCAEGRRGVRCANQRSKSEIPVIIHPLDLASMVLPPRTTGEEYVIFP